MGSLLNNILQSASVLAALPQIATNGISLPTYLSPGCCANHPFRSRRSLTVGNFECSHIAGLPDDQSLAEWISLEHCNCGYYQSIRAKSDHWGDQIV